MDGLVPIKMSGRKYVQSTEMVTASNVFVASMPKDVSEVSVYSYAIHNIGTEGVSVQLQISPDGAIWMADDMEHEILTGLAITAPTNGLTVTAPAEGLAITPPTGGLAITPPTDGLAITSTGLAITAPTGGLLITSAGLAMISATTDVSATLANITDTAGSGDTSYTVLGVETWTFGVVNASLAANAQALVKMQISPDGTNWLDEAGPVTINQNSLTTLVSSIFLKYARVYYSAVNAASAVTLNIFFQGEL